VMQDQIESKENSLPRRAKMSSGPRNPFLPIEHERRRFRLPQ